ncbi:MAG: hypothetical protein L6R40_002615 [Gallowayella cf. fulva]|nr:MAG: hypothetical protein L6R40_002615 [Xanthomendoza cf. fulva]
MNPSSADKFYVPLHREGLIEFVLIHACLHGQCFLPTKRLKGHKLGTVKLFPISALPFLSNVGFHHGSFSRFLIPSGVKKQKSFHVQSAPPSTIPADLLDTRTRPYNRLTITTPNGSLPLLQSIKVPNLGIANVWPNGGRIPDWVRPIDLTTVNLLLDLVIARYATRPSEEATGYGTVGPETAPPLRDLDTRVVVKPYFESLGTPGKALAPLRNKEVAYAAQMF